MSPDGWTSCQNILCALQKWIAHFVLSTFPLAQQQLKKYKRPQELVRWVKMRVLELVPLVTSSSYIYGCWSSLFIGLIKRKCFNRWIQARVFKVTGVKQLHAKILRCVQQILGKDVVLVMYKFLNFLFWMFCW